MRMGWISKSIEQAYRMVGTGWGRGGDAGGGGGTGVETAVDEFGVSGEGLGGLG